MAGRFSSRNMAALLYPGAVTKDPALAAMAPKRT